MFLQIIQQNEFYSNQHIRAEGEDLITMTYMSSPRDINGVSTKISKNWVLAVNGSVIDENQYRNDLAWENNIVLEDRIDWLSRAKYNII